LRRRRRFRRDPGAADSGPRPVRWPADHHGDRYRAGGRGFDHSLEAWHGNHLLGRLQTHGPQVFSDDLRFRVAGACATLSEGRTVVFVPGRCGDARSWGATTAALARFDAGRYTSVLEITDDSRQTIPSSPAYAVTFRDPDASFTALAAELGRIIAAIRQATCGAVVDIVGRHSLMSAQRHPADPDAPRQRLSQRSQQPAVPLPYLYIPIVTGTNTSSVITSLPRYRCSVSPIIDPDPTSGETIHQVLAASSVNRWTCELIAAAVPSRRFLFGELFGRVAVTLQFDRLPAVAGLCPLTVVVRDADGAFMSSRTFPTHGIDRFDISGAAPGFFIEITPACEGIVEMSAVQRAASRPRPTR
jgi:hypothetical protein